MPELGNWLLWLAGLTTAYSLFILIIGIQRGHDGAALIASGHHAALAALLSGHLDVENLEHGADHFNF